MRTFQDLQALGDNEQDRMMFCWLAIQDHLTTQQVVDAGINQQYFDGMNVTITLADRFITDIFGKTVPDVWHANHKIKCQLYQFFVIQQVLFLLGNGVSFSNTRTLNKLGRDFEHTLVQAAIDACNGGISFGFWNFDHLDKYSIQEFVPLYDEETGALSAGIRFWQLADDKPLRIILFEKDGFTEYIRAKDGSISTRNEKRAYVQRVTASATGIDIAPGDPYPGLPIFPLSTHNGLSMMYGHRESIDSYDLIASKLTNNIDNYEFAYWIIKNAPAMADDPEALNEIYQRMVSTKFIALGEGQEIDEHRVEIPFEATDAALDFMRTQLFSDFMAFDPQTVAGGSDTATQIMASYEPLNEKTDLFEFQVTKFIRQLLEFLKIDDKPTYTRSMIVNRQEEIQSVIQAAEYTDEEYTTKKVLDILGDADQAEEVLRRRDAEDMTKLSVPNEPTETDEDEPEEEEGGLNG